MAEQAHEILRGTLDLLILKALSASPAHGYGVAKWIESATNDALAIGEGTLYRRCTVWRSVAGSSRIGAYRRTIGARSTTR